MSLDCSWWHVEAGGTQSGSDVVGNSYLKVELKIRKLDFRAKPAAMGFGAPGYLLTCILVPWTDLEPWSACHDLSSLA